MSARVTLILALLTAGVLIILFAPIFKWMGVVLLFAIFLVKSNP